MDAATTFRAVFDAYLDRYTAHDAAGCAALYAPDGEVHSPFGPPALGRAAIEETHRAWFADGETNKVMDILRADARDDMGYCLVRFAADIADPDGGTRRTQGTSLNVLERTAPRVWTITLTSLHELVDQGA